MNSNQNLAWKIFLSIVVRNFLTIAIFAGVAIYFHHWWIILISAMFCLYPERNTSTQLSSYIYCDYCGETLHCKDVDDVVDNEIKEHGWKRIHIDSTWKDICPKCQPSIYNGNLRRGD